MNKTHSPVALSLVPVFLLGACQGISKAPKNAPRVEVEVTPQIAPSFSTRLMGLDDGFGEAFADLVMANADVGLRFYPVLGSSYGEDDRRPDYAMSVQVNDLVADIDHKTVTQEGADPVIVSSVEKLECMVTSTIVKRRTDAPDLTVGTSTAKGSVSVSKSGDGIRYVIVRDSEDAEPLHASKANLRKAIKSGLQRSLAGLVEPIDREFRPAAPNKQHK